MSSPPHTVLYYVRLAVVRKKVICDSKHGVKGAGRARRRPGTRLTRLTLKLAVTYYLVRHMYACTNRLEIKQYAAIASTDAYSSNTTAAAPQMTMLAADTEQRGKPTIQKQPAVAPTATSCTTTNNNNNINYGTVNNSHRDTNPTCNCCINNPKQRNRVGVESRGRPQLPGLHARHRGDQEHGGGPSDAQRPPRLHRPDPAGILIKYVNW